MVDAEEMTAAAAKQDKKAALYLFVSFQPSRHPQ
jgi:hypothetical protein